LCALLPSTPQGARIDAEDIGQTNPCPMDDTFFDLLRRNVAGLVENFWAAGYVNVIAGSFLRRYSDYVSFRQLLPRPSAVFLVDLLVDREVRDRRRITRAKQTTQEWRDMVDQIPEDQTIRQAADADYRYIGIDTTDLDVARTVQRIKGAIPGGLCRLATSGERAVLPPGGCCLVLPTVSQRGRQHLCRTTRHSAIRARTGLRNVLVRPRRHELCLGGSMTSRQATTVAMSSRRPRRQ
jgi:hypothetical protein